jgi:hypothetical protein
MAILKSAEHVLELLLALGANVHVATLRGQTPCHVVVAVETVAELCACLAAGGSLDEPDYNGETPRMIAVRDEVPLPAGGRYRRRAPTNRQDSTRFGARSEHSRSASDCANSISTRCNCAKSLMRSFGALGSLILFHQWWAIATKVKHFHDRKSKETTIN